jgi:20S proteasome subunit alpha 7
MYSIHDDVKEKQFEIEISWVCDENGRKHAHIPSELLEAAVAAGKAAKEAEE